MDFFDYDTGIQYKDENAHVPSKPKRLSKRQVLASLDNLSTEGLESRLNPDLAPSFKILVIGSSKCGKTSIINRYANNDFTEDYNITLGADYTRKVVEWGKDQQLRLQLWDIAGQDRFALLTRPFFRNANAAVVVCDVTRPLTLEAVRDWKRELDEKMATEGATIPCILLANKCDQLKGVQEAIETGARIENICSDLGFAKWFITSAKSNENVNDAMTFLLTELTKNMTGKPTSKDVKDDLLKDARRSSLKLGNGTSDASAPAIQIAAPRRQSQSSESGGGCSLG